MCGKCFAREKNRARWNTEQENNVFGDLGLGSRDQRTYLREVSLIPILILKAIKRALEILQENENPETEDMICMNRINFNSFSGSYTLIIPIRQKLSQDLCVLTCPQFTI